jgi:hypothetical protein
MTVTSNQRTPDQLTPAGRPRRFWADRWYAGPDPQASPEMFSDAELMLEVKYLMRLNRTCPSPNGNAMRYAAYTRLLGIIAERAS